MIKKGGPGIFAERTHVALSLNIRDILGIGGLDKGLLGVDRSIWCTQVPTGALGANREFLQMLIFVFIDLCWAYIVASMPLRHKKSSGSS